MPRLMVLWVGFTFVPGLMGIASSQPVSPTASPASPQVARPVQVGFGSPYGSNRFYFLQMPAVQKDLNITPEQAGKAKELNDRLQDLYKKPLPDRAAWAKKIREVQSENEKAIDQILKPEQGIRLDQVILQQQGESLFFKAEVIAALKITPEQRKVLLEIQADGSRLNTDLNRIDPLVFARNPGQQYGSGEQRQILIQVMAAVLNPKQKVLLRELIGEPFRY